MHSRTMSPVLDVMHSAWRGVTSTIGQILNRGRQLVLGSKPAEANTSPDSLVLGTDELGSSWLLDFETGEVRLAPMEVPKTALPEGNVPLQMHELTAKALIALFRDAGYGVEELGEHGTESVTVVTEIGVVGVWRHAPEHMLGFWRSYDTPNWEMVDQEHHAFMIEEMNLYAIHTRFILDREDGTVRAEFELPIMAGASRPQILAALRAFVMNTKLRLLTQPDLKIT